MTTGYDTAIGRIEDATERFFAYAVERETIRIKRSRGDARPWTQDPILQAFRFCNVHREDDKVTQWFRVNVRDPLRDKPEVLLATAIFRWFNLIAVGEAVFVQKTVFEDGKTAFEMFLKTGDVSHIENAIYAYCGKGPYITGSYMVSSPPGFKKVPGLCHVIDKFNTEKRMVDRWPGGEVVFDWREMAAALLDTDGHFALEHVWRWLHQFSYQGDFNSFELVTDLRHTALLENAPDILTWANPGPGARRGLNVMYGRDYDKGVPKAQLIEEMRLLLKAAKKLWPKRIEGVKTQTWEMRDVEHTLCETSKYMRVYSGGQQPRNRFR